MDTQIEKAFKQIGNYVFTDANALGRCKTIAEEHGLRANDVASHYDAFAAVRDTLTFDVSVSHLDAFAKFLARELELAAKSKQTATAKPRLVVKAWDEPGDHPTPKRPATDAAKAAASLLTPGGAAPAVTPNARTPPQQTTPGNTQFATRQNKGQVVSSYNDKVAVPPRTQAPRDRALPSLQQLGEPLVVPGVRYLHMMDSVEGKVHAMNDRILAFGDAVRRVMPEAAEVNKTSVAEVSQEPVWVVGRIVPESESGVLNEQSVLLEGSRETSGGARVKLDLSLLPSFRLFPGQVVCAKGLNPTGATFVAQQLVTHCPAGRAAQPAQAQASGTPAAPTTSTARALSMAVAAGPFTTSDNLRYEPLDELLSFCSSSDVNQVVLIGPFVDAEHPMVREGTLNVTYEQVFREEVVKRLAAWQGRHPSCRVVLMPSVRDVYAAPVFPQPPLPEGSLPSGERLRCLQSPCTWASEGLVVAGSSHDVLMHLSAAEVARGQQAGQDALAARAAHVIGQRSFYPLFPAPLGSCLDTSHYSGLQLPCTPDLLLLPSNLTPFAKLVSLAPGQPGGLTTAAPGAPEAVVAVNPGRLAKGVSGGTFAHVYLAPASAGGGSRGRRAGQQRTPPPDASGDPAGVGSTDVALG